MITDSDADKIADKVSVSIDEHHAKIVSRLNRNAWIFGAILLLVLITIWRVFVMGKAVTATGNLSVANTTAIAEVKAHQDLYRQQYLDYIKGMIQAMNQLQDKNKNIDVPKAPVPHPIIDGLGFKPIDENELRRIPQDGPPKPTPTPIVKTKIKTVVRVKKRPTPKPVRWPWDATP